MIDLYYGGTPNGLKLKLFMQESGLPHRVLPVNIGKGEQFKPEFLAVSPNNKIPALVDHAPPGGGAPQTMKSVLAFKVSSTQGSWSLPLRAHNEW